MTTINVIVVQTYSSTRLLRLVDVKGDRKFIIHGKFWVHKSLPTHFTHDSDECYRCTNILIHTSIKTSGCER